MRHVSWRRTAGVAGAALALALPGVVGAQAASAEPGAPGAHGASSARTADSQHTARAAQHSAPGTTTTLRIKLDRGKRGAPAPRLSRAERARLGEGLAVRKKGPAVLRCDKNPSWSDARGTLHARFNCHHSNINWGYRISARVRAVITGPVHEQGVSWWRNGKRMPRNAGHVVGKNYLFHGTLKPVHHGDHVQFQDFMKFRVNVGGKPGTGTLAWAGNVKAKK